MRLSPRIVFIVRSALAVSVLGAAAAYRHEIAAALRMLLTLHPVVLLVFPLYCTWNLLATLGWRALIRVTSPDRSSPSVARLWTVRLEAGALNLVLPFASVGGEVLRAALTSRAAKRVTGSTFAVLLDNFAAAAGGVVFTAAGLACRWQQVPGGDRVRTALLIAAAAIAVGVVALPWLLERLRHRIPQRWGGGAVPDPAQLSNRRTVLALVTAVLWHLSGRLLNAAEIYIAMVALGLPAGPVDAIFATALMTGLSLVFFFVPGQVGAAELGIVSGLGVLGIPAPAALSVALVRRARQLTVAAVGLALLTLVEGRRTAPRPESRTLPGGVR